MARRNRPQVTEDGELRALVQLEAAIDERRAQVQAEAKRRMEAARREAEAERARIEEELEQELDEMVAHSSRMSSAVIVDVESQAVREAGFYDELDPQRFDTLVAHVLEQLRERILGNTRNNP